MVGECGGWCTGIYIIEYRGCWNVGGAEKLRVLK
jgi:hypothetical protein